jgi:2-phospho-L-lactate guanylyltransferase
VNPNVEDQPGDRADQHGQDCRRNQPDHRPDGSAPIAVIIPVKSFDLAKERLSETLMPAERADLARSMAAGVIAASHPLPTYVVCGSDEVASWAIGNGASVIWHEPPGLNRAVTHATETLDADGYGHVIVAHGDLPLATSLVWVADFDGVTIVPDRPGQGTNVMALPLGTGFRFHYGVGSAAAHKAEAKKRNLALRVIPDRRLGLDIDTPGDLLDLERQRADRSC